jgi:hypothetical protein
MHIVGAVEIVAGLVVAVTPASAASAWPAGSEASSSACCWLAATPTSPWGTSALLVGALALARLGSAFPARTATEAGLR